MEIDKAIKVLENEQRCVIRQTGKQCDRNCAKCDLVLDDNVILSTYEIAIAALHALQEAKSSSGWTSVKDRLPDAKGEYMVTYHPCHWDYVQPDVKVGFDCFRGKTTWAKKKFQRVTHWMPLPAPPKEDKADE